MENNEQLFICFISVLRNSRADDDEKFHQSVFGCELLTARNVLFSCPIRETDDNTPPDFS